MRASRISVIIPAYRASGTICRAIDSVLRQSLLADQIVVVDDGSPDDLASVLRTYDGRLTFIRKENGGAASARNVGLEHATGDFIAFLDADDFWEPHKLATHLQIFERDPKIGLTSSRFYVTSRTGEEVTVFPGNEVLYDQTLKLAGEPAFELATKISTITVVVRREVIGDQRFPEDLRTAEDRHLWVRLVSSSYVYFIGQPLASAVEEPGSLSRSSVRDDCSNMLRVISDFREMLGPSGVRKWQALAYRRCAGAHLAGGCGESAIFPSIRRLSRQPFTREGWWVFARSVLTAASDRLGWRTIEPRPPSQRV